MSSIENQIQAFVAGTASEHAFPGLSVEERKLVKLTAEKFGLRSSSFGMGNERQIHIFKPAPEPVKYSDVVKSSMKPALAPVKYSVKNTFVDGHGSPEQALIEPAHHSMPVGALQEHITAEEEQSFAATVLFKVDDSPRNSEVDTSSTKDSDSEQQDPQISIKNSFVHFEIDSKETADPRIIQSMPAGTFSEHIEAERAANMKSRKWKPLPLSETSESDTIEGSSAMLFPSTPNADNEMSFAEHSQGVPLVQWHSGTTPVSESLTALPSACWTPQASFSGLPPQGPSQVQASVTVLPPAFWAPPAAVPMSAPGVASENQSSPAAIPAMEGSTQGLPTQPLPQGPMPAAVAVAAPQESRAVLAPAVWENESSSVVIPATQGPVQGLQQESTPPMPPQAAAPPMQPQGSTPPTPPQGAGPAPPPAMPPQGAAPAHFMPGTHVVLQGLASQPDFNGLRGTVSAFDANCGRYNVFIEIGSNAARRMVKVKFQNLLLAQPPCSVAPFPQAAVMSRPGKASLVLDQMV